MTDEAPDDAVVDRTVPKGEWAFDAEVAAAFDDMLRRSIPQHDLMRAAVYDLGHRFVRDDAAIVDLGCSRGEALAPFAVCYPKVRIVGVEASEPMRSAAEARFLNSPNVKILGLDLRRGFPQERAGLILSVLTLQFIPVTRRAAVLEAAFERLLPGGALILVEKVLGATSRIDALFVEEHEAMKRRNGYTAEDVARKRASLEGVLNPATARTNVEELHAAGFRQVDCFWRWMNFAGWLAVKDRASS